MINMHIDITHPDWVDPWAAGGTSSNNETNPLLRRAEAAYTAAHLAEQAGKPYLHLQEQAKTAENLSPILDDHRCDVPDAVIDLYHQIKTEHPGRDMRIEGQLDPGTDLITWYVMVRSIPTTST